MKLTELDTQTTDSIYVARLPQAGGAGVAEPAIDAATAIEIAPHPARPAAGELPVIAKPPALAFVTEEARPRRIDLRLAALLVLVVVMAGLLWVLIDSGPNGRPRATPAHHAPLKLTPNEQRVATAARARAAAIAQLKRDRGTDAQWQDTIPAPAG
jgi:hypothetical protein